MPTHADLNGSGARATHHAQSTRHHVETHAQPAAVRACALQRHAKLMVLVPAIVAQEMQPPALHAHDEVRVAITVKVRGREGVDAPLQLVETELRRDIDKVFCPEIAPDAQAVADGNDVEPTVVVVVNEPDLPWLKTAEGNGRVVGAVVERDDDGTAIPLQHVGAQIIVHVTHGENSITGDHRDGTPRGHAVRPHPAPLLQQHGRGLLGARHQQILRLVVVPILRGQLPHAGERGRVRARLHEIHVLEIAHHAQLGVRAHGHEIEVAAKVQVREESVHGGEVFQPGEARRLRGRAVRGEAEEMHTLIAQHQRVGNVVLVQVRHQPARVASAVGEGEALLGGVEFSAAVPQHPEARVLAHQQMIRAVAREIDHAQRPGELPAALGKHHRRRVREDHLHTLAFGLLQLEGHARLGVFATLQSSGREVGLGIFRHPVGVRRRLRLRVRFPVEPTQHGGETEMHAGEIRIELRDLFIQRQRFLEASQALVGQTEMQAHRVHARIDVPRLLEELHRVGEMPLPQLGQTGHVKRRRRGALRRQHRRRELQGAFVLIREEAGIGQVQLGVRMIRLKRECPLEAGQRGQRLRAVELRLAHVAQAEEFIARHRLFFPSAAGE